MGAVDFQNGFICGMATRGLTTSTYKDPALAFLIDRGVTDTFAAGGLVTFDSDSVGIENGITYPDPLPVDPPITALTETFDANIATIEDDVTVTLIPV